MDARILYNGRTWQYTPGSDVAAGDVVVIGNIIGVASQDIKSGTTGTINFDGVYEVAKVGSALTAGAHVYWNSNSKYVTATANGNAYFGRVLVAADSSAATAIVRLEPTYPVPAAATDQAITSATATPTASVIAKYDENGLLSSGTPTADAHVSTKAYVDAAIAAAIDTP